MPRSKTRKHHHEQQRRSGTVDKAGKNRSSVPVAIFFLALIGLGIAFFAAGSSIPWMLTGVALGAVGGYYFGKQLDKSFSKK